MVAREVTKMTQRRRLLIGAMLLAVTGTLAVVHSALEQEVAAQAKSAVRVPMFEVDPFWPKPLPNHWILGMVIGAAVDAQDHLDCSDSITGGRICE
jgi:hypothetical protein